jgi:hypothetical protein
MPIEGIQQAGGGAWPIQEPAFARPVGAGASILQFGELIWAVVLRITDQKAVVDLKGSSFNMDLRPGLQEGSKVLVRVAGLTPEPVLEVVGHPGQEIEAEVVNLIRTNLAETIPTEQSLANLQQVLAEFVAGDSPQATLPSVARLQTFLQRVLASPTAPTSDRVARLIEDGGLQYEAKLASLVRASAPETAESGPSHPGTLAHLANALEPETVARQDWKGLLLQVQQDLRQESPAPLRSSQDVASGQAPHPEQAPAQATANTSLASLIDHQLHHLENQQALNLLAQWHGSAFALELPLVVHQSLTTVHLAIEPDAQSESGQSDDPRSGHNLLFQMDLEHFGPTKIEVWVAARALRANFFVANEPAVAQIQSEFPALKQSLQALGFHDVLLAADPLARLSPEKRQKFDEVRRGVPADVHLLDVEV